MIGEMARSRQMSLVNRNNILRMSTITLDSLTQLWFEPWLRHVNGGLILLVFGQLVSPGTQVSDEGASIHKSLGSYPYKS